MASKRWMVTPLAMAMMMSAVSPVGATENDSDEPIPVIVAPDDPMQTPAPTCSVCTRLKKKAEDDGASATATLVHEGDFVGDAELVVWLDDDRRASVWITDLSIIDGAEVEVALEATAEWDWDDVQFAWVRFYSTL